jgi:hypothetical protein
LKLIFEANGFAQFKIKKDSGSGLWKIDISEEDRGKPTFVLYTGTETAEEKEIVRNIFNSSWEYVPSEIVNELKLISSNNHYGEIIKILMITASGAEGISLKNVRHVHIVESYWHPVRSEQVIGRARRICSHQDLPESKRRVDVYMYLMTFTEEQKKGDASIELRLNDVSKVDNVTPLTSDEALYEISTLKEEVTSQILKSVKEAAIDCALHSKVGDTGDDTGDSKDSDGNGASSSSGEQLVCFSFGTEVDVNAMSYTPSYTNQEIDKTRTMNVKTIKWKAVTFTLGGKKYKLKLDERGKKTNEVYDYDSFERAVKVPGINPIYIGKLVIETKDGKKVAKIVSSV